MDNSPLLSCIESRVENGRTFYGRFQLGPFQEGDGVTVANSLRRALLAEITGVAITAVKIKGVLHEYSNLSGVRETVLNILLNLKEVVLTSSFKVQEPQIGYLHVQGPGVVKAKDLRLPSCIQCVNPEQHIATVLCNGAVQMKVLICGGKRYTSQSPYGRETSVRGLQGGAEKQGVCIPGKRDLPTHLWSFAAASRASSSNLSREGPTAQPVQSKTGNTGLGLNKTQASLLMTFAHAHQTPANKAARVQAGREVAGRPVLPPQPPTWTQPINFNRKRFSNVLPVDAVFMPVNRVNFIIESDQGFSCSSGGKQPLDLIVLEVWTDGSVHPRQAIYRAAKTLTELVLPLQRSKPLKALMIPAKTACYPFAALRRSPLSSDRVAVLIGGGVRDRGRRKTKHLASGKKPAVGPRNPGLLVSTACRKTLSLDIGNLDLQVLPYTVLKRNKIETVNDLLRHSSQDLLELQGFTERHLAELKRGLQALGLEA